jgi:hypothetical protein
LLENVAAMESKSGPNWQRWCAGMARAAGRGMLDDARNEA